MSLLPRGEKVPVRADEGRVLAKTSHLKLPCR
jgi:hypothetical protein